MGASALSNVGVLRGPRGATGPAGPDGAAGPAGEVVAPYANVAALKAIPDGELSDGQKVYVNGDPIGWVWNVSTGAGFESDDETLIRRTATLLGSAGRLYRDGSPSPATIAALRNATSGAYKRLHVLAYSSLGDGGGGEFIKRAGSPPADDGGNTIVPTGVTTFWYERQKDLTHRSTTSYGAKADNATSASAAIADLTAALGNPATRTRAEHIKFPNATTAHDATALFENFSGVLSGAGAGSSRNNQSAHRWIGVTPAALLQLQRSWGTHIEHQRFIGDPNHKPSAAIDLNAAGGLTNTNVSLQNIWIGGMSGNDYSPMATAMIAAGTTPQALTLSEDVLNALKTANNILFTIVGTGVRGVATFDVTINGVSIATGVTTAAAYAIPGLDLTAHFPTGTYTSGDTYKSDFAGFTSGVTCSGSNLQNDQSLMIKCHFENIKDYGVDFQQSQNVLWGLLGCTFNGMKASVRTKTRHTLLQTSFHSVVENVVQLDGDSDIMISNIGAEQCGRLIYGSAGSGTGNGLSIHGGYFQCNNRYSIDNVVDLQGGGSQVHLHIKDLSFTNDDMIADQAKIAITDSNHVALYLDNISWYDGHSAIPHLSVATAAGGQTRWIRFDHLGVPYQNFWTHGDHANRQLGLRWDMPVGVNLPPNVGVTCVDDSGNTHNQIKFVTATGRIGIGDATTPVELQNDLVARVSGLDIVGFRNLLTLQGKVNFSEANATPGITIADFTTNAAGAHDFLGTGQNATGTGATVGGGFDWTPGTGNTGGHHTFRNAASAVRLKIDDNGIGVFAHATAGQSADMGALADSIAGSVALALAAIPDPSDTPITADALRDDLVANVIPKIRNAFSSIAASVNLSRAAHRQNGWMA